MNSEQSFRLPLPKLNRQLLKLALLSVAMYLIRNINWYNQE